MRLLLQASSMKLHNPSCMYVAIKCSGCSDSVPLQSPNVFDIAVASFERQTVLHS